MVDWDYFGGFWDSLTAELEPYSLLPELCAVLGNGRNSLVAMDLT